MQNALTEKVLGEKKAKKVKNLSDVARGLTRTVGLNLWEGVRSGDFLAAAKESVRNRKPTYARGRNFGRQLEVQAARIPEKTFLFFEDEKISYAEMNRRVNRVASGLAKLGYGENDAASVMLLNTPGFLYAFYATQKLGMCGVPTNTALRGDGLAYILNHSESKVLFIHHTLLKAYSVVRSRLTSVRQVVVDVEGADKKLKLPKGAVTLQSLLDPSLSDKNPGVEPQAKSKSCLMYTSGTTGHPKGVVYTYDNPMFQMMPFLANLLYMKSDVLFTCLPLYHMNALFLTMGNTLFVGATAALSRRFSASRFWDEIRRFGATTFNGLGGVMPILMKQPPKPNDADNRVRRVMSAACPAEIWEEFEDRFGLLIWEFYGAVDGGGFATVNLGQAPVGSIGKPLGKTKYKLVTESGREAQPGEPGELIFWVGEDEKREVAYYKNEEASKKKTEGGWLRTGDVVYADEKGYLFFAGRNTDSMRRRGENVSALEVENAVVKHPGVLEAAAFGVPSPLGEDDIMVCLTTVEGKKVDPAALHRFLQDELARFAIPRYIDVLDELPKTGTHRVQKNVLKERGVTETTWDAEKQKKK